MKNNVNECSLGLICNKLLIENHKMLLIAISGYLGLCALFGIMLGALGSPQSQMNFIIYVFIAGLGCSLATSRMFSETTGKEGKIALLMTPAKASVKFLPRLISTIIGMVILSIIGYFVYGLTDILTFGLISEIWFPLFNPFANWGKNSADYLWIVLTIFMFTESIFAFGSVVWPRKSFLKSIAVLALIMLCLILGIAGLVKLCLSMDAYVELTDEQAFLTSLLTTTNVISLGIFIWAYYRFKKLTI